VFVFERPIIRVEASGKVIQTLKDQPPLNFDLAQISDPFGFFLEQLYKFRVTGRIGEAPLSYAHCNADVTHNCNLRCNFCFADFSESSHTRMSEENFIKLTQIAPLVDDGRVFISCAYEPYLHLRFTELLALLPAATKAKYFFTTNLSVKPMTVDQVTALAKANIAYFNISMDSRDPALFEAIRINAKHAVFAGNLDKVTKIFSLYPQAPPVTFITMALKSNLAELESLSRAIYEDLGLAPGKATHEIRMAFLLERMPKDWAAREMLSRDEWAALFERLKQWPHRVAVLNQTYEPAFGGMVGGQGP
jgi:molybdenum cofactor biosynthesis enzyme MoaA